MIIRRIVMLAVPILVILLAPLSPAAAFTHDTINANQSVTINPPVVTTAVFNGSTLAVFGSLRGVLADPYRIDFYIHPTCDPSGRVYIGSSDTVADSRGQAYFWGSFPKGSVGAYVTALATDGDGRSSTISACRRVTAGSASSNLLTNPSFETNIDANRRVPDGWGASWNGGRSWQECNSANVREGLCTAVAALQGGYNRLDQTIRVSGAAGDKVSLYFWISGSNLVRGSYARMRLFFYNNGSLTESRLVNLPVDTFGWQYLALELTITRPFNSIEVEFQTSNTSGHYWMDAFHLFHIDQ